MRWMIGGQGWPIAGGARLIPAGTLVGDGGIPLAELPSPMPMDAVSLDDAAYAQMREWYPYHLHMLLVGPDVGKATAQTASFTEKGASLSSPSPKKAAKG